MSGVEGSERAEVGSTFNLRVEGSGRGHRSSPTSQRFNFFLIDTGWNETISKLVHKHFPKLLLHHHNPQGPRSTS